MNYHIVRNGETIDKIAVIYNLEIIEIKEANPHIRSFDNLVPGLKLRLPEIPESVAIELNDVEPFIEDYYPKLTSFEMSNDNIPKEVVEETKKAPENPVPPVHNPVPKTVKPVYYNPYFNPYFYYPYYNMYRKRTK